jgi:hypothetical protein
MITRHPRLLFVLAAALSASAGSFAPARAAPRGVIELFTSQGCSSCPPADALLAELGHDPDLITLTLPVDYWDRLGWKDTFASHAFTERQTAYADTRGDGQIYTPQAIVNGTAFSVGSRRAGIETAVDITARNLTVPITLRRSGGEVAIEVGAGTGDAARLVAMPFLASREVIIGRGENARRTVTYTNIVREIIPLGDWTGKPLRRTLSAARLKGYDGVAVLLQTGSPRKPGAIIGAGRVGLRTFQSSAVAPN